MKKNTVIIIVALCLIVAGIASAGAAFVVSDFSFDGFSSEKFEEVTYTVEGDFDHLLIATDIHDITLAPSSDNTCRIVGSESRNFKIEYEIEGGTLVVKAGDERKWYDYVGMFSGEAGMTLYLPKSAYTSVTAASDTGDILLPDDFTFTGAAIATSTGDIEVRAKITGELGLAASTGHITVIGVEPTKLDVSVSTGKIILENIKAGEITSKGTTGDILLKNVYAQNEISIERDTGDVTLTSVIAGAFNIETSTGDVKFTSSDAESIDITTDTGDVEGSLISSKTFTTETDTGKVRVPQSPGEGTCKIRTDTGDINITIE